MAFHRTLIPGQQFPDVVVSKVGGGQLSLRPSSDNKPRIIVVCRGAFCTFCQSTLANISDNKHKLDAAGIEIVVLSADTQQTATDLALELNLPSDLAIGYGLNEEQMTRMSTYISDPTNYITQTHRFSEPATFMLMPDGTIKYLEYASMPMGGRINIDNYIAGYRWSTQNAADHPEFNSVVWGSVQQPELAPVAHQAAVERQAELVSEIQPEESASSGHYPVDKHVEEEHPFRQSLGRITLMHPTAQHAGKLRVTVTSSESNTHHHHHHHALATKRWSPTTLLYDARMRMQAVWRNGKHAHSMGTAEL